MQDATDPADSTAPQLLCWVSLSRYEGAGPRDALWAIPLAPVRNSQSILDSEELRSLAVKEARHVFSLCARWRDADEPIIMLSSFLQSPPGAFRCVLPGEGLFGEREANGLWRLLARERLNLLRPCAPVLMGAGAPMWNLLEEGGFRGSTGRIQAALDQHWLAQGLASTPVSTPPRGVRRL